MRKIFAFGILLMPILLSSCEKEGLSRIGFDTSISSGSNGTTTMKVSEDSGRLTLTGTVTLTEGQLLLELLDPDGINAYSNSFQGPVEASIDEFYNAKKGTWTLNYNSINASGNIKVHLNR